MRRAMDLGEVGGGLCQSNGRIGCTIGRFLTPLAAQQINIPEITDWPFFEAGFVTLWLILI